MVRDWVPASPQVPSKPPQVLQAPVEVMPQGSPSVVREQPRVSIVARLTHVPASQTRSVTVRDWVPVVSQSPPKPPQLPQGPSVGVPQTKSSGRVPVATQRGEPVEHSISPTSQGFPVSQAAPGTQAVVQVPPTHAPSSPPTVQAVPVGAKASMGHSKALPVQLSATSHWPAAARQGVPASAGTSSGHSSELPSHRSAASQPDALARQSVPRSFGVSGTHAGTPPAQLTRPRAQGPASQTAPGVQSSLQLPLSSQKPSPPSGSAQV